MKDILKLNGFEQGRFSSISDKIILNETIFNADFSDCSFYEVDFVNCILNCISFSSNYSDCRDLTFKNCILKDVCFRKSDLENFNFQNCKFLNTSFSRSGLLNFSFIYCKFTDVSFTVSDLCNLQLVETQLENVKFLGNDLYNITIENSILKNVKCSNLEFEITLNQDYSRTKIILGLEDISATNTYDLDKIKNKLSYISLGYKDIMSEFNESKDGQKPLKYSVSLEDEDNRFWLLRQRYLKTVEIFLNNTIDQKEFIAQINSIGLKNFENNQIKNISIDSKFIGSSLILSDLNLLFKIFYKYLNDPESSDYKLSENEFKLIIRKNILPRIQHYCNL